MGEDGKPGSDAEVTFDNICSTLGITTDGSSGLYYKEENGKKKLAIKSDVIYSKDILADNLRTVNATAQNLKVKAANIDDLTADKLTAGTIDASKITIINLNADNITSGTIKAEKIQFSDDEVISAFKSDIKVAFGNYTFNIVPQKGYVTKNLAVFEQSPQASVGSTAYRFKQLTIGASQLSYVIKEATSTSTTATTINKYTIDIPTTSGMLLTTGDVVDNLESK